MVKRTRVLLPMASRSWRGRWHGTSHRTRKEAQILRPASVKWRARSRGVEKAFDVPPFLVECERIGGAGWKATVGRGSPA